MDENEETLLSVLKEIRDEMRLITACLVIQLPEDVRERLKQAPPSAQIGILKPLRDLLFSIDLYSKLAGLISRPDPGLTKREV